MCSLGEWGGGEVSGKGIFDKESNSFLVGGGGVFIYKLTRNPNLTFLGGGGGGLGGG